MPPERSCPIQNQPANEGGRMDASTGENGELLFRFSYTPEHGTGNPRARCAFRTLSKQALAHEKIDRIQACRRCARFVRVQSAQ
jgi:hypothetical protein